MTVTVTMVRLSPLRLLCAAAVVLCVLLVTSQRGRLVGGARGYDVVQLEVDDAAAADAAMMGNDSCAPFAGMTIVLKMGAGQVATQLPLFLARLSRCQPDLLLFSDRKDTCNGHDIADALAHVRPEYRFHNADFDVYDALQRAPANATTTADGWRLDKYKLLPMVEWASYLRPDAQWYLFVELDTYVNYANMARFLARFTPATAHYFGSPVWPKKKRRKQTAKKQPVFAHAGSSFVLSRAALDKIMALGRMFGQNKHFPGTHFFGVDVKQQCCGDEVLAQVLKTSGVSLRGYWPMFNVDKPTTMPFNQQQWCEALITMHHLDPDDFAALTQWETGRAHPSRPLTFEELFSMIEPHLQHKADDWSNMSGDVTYKRGKSAAKSLDNCSKACQNDANCLQFEYSSTECRLGYSIRLGHGQKSQGTRKWTSGWMLERIQMFKQAHSPCKGARFVYSNP